MVYEYLPYTMKKEEDLELKKRVKCFIKETGRYCRCEDILQGLSLPYSRVYLSYRGIDVTAINRELGFVRRDPTRVLKTIPGISKEDLLERIKSIIIGANTYLTRHVLSREHKIHSQWITYYSIDTHAINTELGFHKDSPMSRFPDKPGLIKNISEYISSEGRYISQQEIVHVFNVSLSFITKNIDTRALNFDLGYSQDYAYFENMVLKVLQKYFGEVSTQKTFDDCRSKVGYLLRYDFFVHPNLLIEADGSQHWDTSHRFYTEGVVDRDLIKSTYAKENRLILIRIPFKGRWETSAQYIENTLLENLKSLITTKQLETTNLKVLEALGLGNQQPSPFAETHGEGSTTIPKGSRVQENPKHVATGSPVEDIVCSQGKL